MIDNELRREQTRRQLSRVNDAIENWFSARTSTTPSSSDPNWTFAALHKTRLDTLHQVLSGGLKVLIAEVCAVAVDPGRDGRIVYAECRTIEQAALWIERVWLFYADKFDQRSDPNLRPLLEAADELVWSCYKPVFARPSSLPAGVVQGPAPLAYLDAEYSPATWEAAKLAPQRLRESTQFAGLQTFLKTLPVPILRLPTWCVNNPWWLVVIAHEVGHNIQRELDLVYDFEDLVASACPDAAAERWRRWSAEIFADLFSVAMLGDWAVKALVELEVADDASMTADAGDYPPAVIRLKLLARAADRLQFAGTAAVAALDLDRAAADHALEDDLGLIGAVLDKALGPLTRKKASIAVLAGLDADQPTWLKTRSAYWAGQLPGTPAVPTPGLEAARYITCGAWQAWQTALQEQERPRREQAIGKVADNTVSTIRKARPGGTRAGGAGTIDPDAAGEVLAQQLLRQLRQASAT